MLVMKLEIQSAYGRLIICLFSESLILAQNERWRRGLGMQVEQQSADSSRKVRICGG